MVHSNDVVGEVRPALLICSAPVGFLLLIVFVNVADLLMVRVTARMRGLAMRTALGAGRRHLVGQMLSESCCWLSRAVPPDCFAPPGRWMLRYASWCQPRCHVGGIRIDGGSIALL